MSLYLSVQASIVDSLHLRLVIWSWGDPRPLRTWNFKQKNCGYSLSWKLKQRFACHLITINVPNIVFVKYIVWESPPRWLRWLRHSAHRAGRSVRGSGVQSPGRPVDFVFGFQGRMLWNYFLGQAKRVRWCPL